MTLPQPAPWTPLPATEKLAYVRFHEMAYAEDLRHAEKNSGEFPRWSVISGFYAMHDATKLLLGEKFSAKISQPNAHDKTIDALERYIHDPQIKAKLLELLREAEGIVAAAEQLKERTLPTLLRHGKRERGKAQYYTSAAQGTPQAERFLKEIVRPYLKLIEGLR